MRAQHCLNRSVSLVLALLAFAANGSAFADPPAQAARLAYTAGDVSFSPAGDDRWLQATVNRPLTIGDRLWADRGARAEIQVGGAVLRMGENTSLEFLNLDDRLVQVQVDEGTLNVRVRRLDPRRSVEVTTPNLAFTVQRPGSYRIEVDPMDDATAIIVRSGQGEVYGERAAYTVNPRQAFRFGGSGLRSYEYIATPRPDEFDRWASGRDRRADTSVSARYVSRDVIGYEDLDAHGTWRNEPGYGRVWAPSRVANDWTPYRDGHWAWVEPWGWSWVDDAPWGYAVSHYGRWANLRGRWAWVPAPVQSRAVYSPALVGFVGGSNLQVAQPGGGTGGVAWFPLAPREVYRPPYQVSRGYFENVNRSNTNISPATVGNAYSNVNAPNPYANRLVLGAIVVVAAAAFIHSQSVAKAAVQAPPAAASAPVAAAAPVAPVQQSVRGAAPTAKTQPPAPTRERRIVARTAPPAAPATFAAKPGAAPATAAPKAAPPAPTKSVIVAAPPQAAPTAPPPAKAPEGKPAAKREGRDDRKDDRKAPAAPAAIPPAPAQAAPAPAAPSAPAKPAPAPAAVKPAPAPEPAKPAAAPAPIAPKPAAAAPTVPPPAKAPEGKPAAKREGRDDRKDDRKAPAAPAAIPPAPAQAAPAPAAPSAPAKPAPAVVKPAPAPEPAKPAAAPAPIAPKPAAAAPAVTQKAVPAPAKADPATAMKAVPDALKQGDGKKGDAKRDDRKRDDRKRAQEDKRRADEDQRRADEDKKGAQKDGKRPEIDKRRAEEDRRRAEEDKRRAEEDKKQ